MEHWPAPPLPLLVHFIYTIFDILNVCSRSIKIMQSQDKQKMKCLLRNTQDIERHRYTDTDNIYVPPVDVGRLYGGIDEVHSAAIQTILCCGSRDLELAARRHSRPVVK